MIRTPKFWYDKRHGILSNALIPFSKLYNFARCIHNQMSSETYKSSLPVICVGNITAGGSGKTPTAIAILSILKNNKICSNPCFLSRGYGGDFKKPTLVDHNTHSHLDVGDEALLLSRHAPTIVSSNRGEGAKFAEHLGHDLIIMDDGLQNQSLHKNFKLIVIDGKYGFGNKRTLPSGPLRLPLADGLKLGDAYLIVGNAQNSLLDDLPSGGLVFTSSIQANIDQLDLRAKYIAFCGLAHPEKFYNTLNDLNVDVIKTVSFGDHHAFSSKDMQRLKRMARDAGAKLITTEKDAVRLHGHDDILSLPIQLNIHDTTSLVTSIKSHITC